MALPEGLREVNDEELEIITGGYIYQPPGNTKLQVIDWGGNVMARFSHRDEANQFVWDHGMSFDKISTDQLNALRDGSFEMD